MQGDLPGVSMTLKMVGHDPFLLGNRGNDS